MGGNQRQFIAIKQTARIQLTVLIVKHHVSFPAIHKSSHGDVGTKKVGGYDKMEVTVKHKI